MWLCLMMQICLGPMKRNDRECHTLENNRHAMKGYNDSSFTIVMIEMPSQTVHGNDRECPAQVRIPDHDWDAQVRRPVWWCKSSWLQSKGNGQHGITGAHVQWCGRVCTLKESQQFVFGHLHRDHRQLSNLHLQTVMDHELIQQCRYCETHRNSLIGMS